MVSFKRSGAYVLALLAMTITAHADSLPNLSVKDLAPTTNWAGPYVGAHVGYGWGKAEQAQTNGGMPYGPFEGESDGAVAGVSLGYNYQIDRVVLGLEVEGGYLDLGGEGRIPSSNPSKYQTVDVDSGFYGLIAGRLGVALGRSLVYGKGGYVFLDSDVGQTTTNPGYVTHRSDSLQGWAYGGGVEHMITDRISLKVEYLHFDFDTVTGDQQSISDTPVGYKYTNQTDVSADTVTFGAALKF